MPLICFILVSSFFQFLHKQDIHFLHLVIGSVPALLSQAPTPPIQHRSQIRGFKVRGDVIQYQLTTCDLFV